MVDSTMTSSNVENNVENVFDVEMDPIGRSLITVATCNLNQWALDFDGNLSRIRESCRRAKALGATYRLGPELEICGYGCEDHFLEPDTYEHCWESLAALLYGDKKDDDNDKKEEGVTEGLLCDFGMPVLCEGVRYNCRVLACNGEILMICPKTALADDGNYRESRYFTAFRGPPRTLTLPPHLFSCQKKVPFGTLSLRTGCGTSVACETCEELWTPRAPHIDWALRGILVMGNGSGSHHELRKLDQRVELMRSATRKCGGVYLYANQRGCDGGGRLYFDGSAMVLCNGQLLAQASQFGLSDVEVVTATIDLEDVRTFRASTPSRGRQAVDEYVNNNQSIQRIDAPSVRLTVPYGSVVPSRPIDVRYHTPAEECGLGPSNWLWDYLRRSGAGGFFLPLSGGADSSAVAAIVGILCVRIYEASHTNPHVAEDLRRVCRISSNDWLPVSPHDVASRIFHTCFMGHTENSSTETRDRAARVAAQVGSYHWSLSIDALVEAVLTVFDTVTGGQVPRPQFQCHGGTLTEDLARQNIQARLRMVLAYFFAQLLPWVRSKTSSSLTNPKQPQQQQQPQQGGFLLVLGSANVDEGLRGYMTKYDCSSADLNPIGAINKADLKQLLLYASQTYQWPALYEVATATPTAELRPIQSTNNTNTNNNNEPKTTTPTQTDEEDMGMTYEELSVYGRLRKLAKCGPVTMYKKLMASPLTSWIRQAQAQAQAATATATLPSSSWTLPTLVAHKVKTFFHYYSVNRHKMVTITPSYHAEAYSPDDNRFDLRPFLYNTKWTRQFAKIDQLVQRDQHVHLKRTTNTSS